VIDIGTAKVCCLIAAPNEVGRMALLGLGHQRSRGIKSGMVVDAGEAEGAARAAVAQAERMAGVTLGQAAMAIACGRIGAQQFVARSEVEGTVVADHDLDRVLAGGEAFVARSGRLLVYLGRSSWRLDGIGGVREPRGMAARELSIAVSAVTVDEAPVRNLLAVIERCHLEVERLVPSPVASAMAVTTEEERAGEVLVVDLGAGTATLSAFADGLLVAVETSPVGGNHVTFDIARTLMTTVAEAERIKTLYGTLVKAQSDASEPICYPIEGDEGPVLYQTTKAQLRSLITPRIDGLFALIAERLGASGQASLLAGRIVLTGGGSQLLGLDQAWMQRFGGEVRIGRPRPLVGMPAGLCSPALATVIGLASTPVEALDRGALGRACGGRRGYLGRMQRWIGDGF
jgi:cell division protein FtsA